MKKIQEWKHESAVRALIAAYRQTGEDTRQAGREWYPFAGQVAREIAPTQAQGAGIIAALSPLNSWTGNIWQARELAADPVNAPRRTLGLSDAKARRIAQGANPLEVLGGQKVVAFFHACNGDTTSVVIDRWAMRATGFTPKRDGACTAKQYRNYVAAYRDAAAQCGEHAADFQAIIWIWIRKSAD